ncbi:hypothetical protein HMPREF0578_1009 [Mobiluncus mulieris 28-1]|nr:hypothetical protein HMPREF0578_1009 [Mobiluncus mulieris 28-1]
MCGKYVNRFAAKSSVIPLRSPLLKPRKNKAESPHVPPTIFPLLSDSLD